MVEIDLSTKIPPFKENIKLLPGEIVCDKCNGRGYKNAEGDKYIFTFRCNKCKGAGKLTWVENVFGIKPNYNYLNELLNAANGFFNDFDGIDG
jgi:hypothetical protein